MKDKLLVLYNRYKSFINYGIFGVLTTIVNYVSYWIFSEKLGIITTIAVAMAWVISCSFAFITNKIWVFESKDRSKDGILREVISFFMSRLATLGVEEFMMWTLVDILGFNNMIIKLIANIVVIILNYVFSKLFVFKKNAVNQ